MKSKIYLAITILGLISIGLFIFVFSVMGDRNCRIEIQNDGQGQLILKTFKYFHYENELTVDSVVLKQNEKMEIGSCINCSVPDTLDIDFDAIGIYDAKGDFEMMNKGELIKYLETKDKDDCITYLVR
jgi:hypothetical protein